MQPQTKKYVADVAIFAISQVAFYFAFKYILASMDPNKGKKKEAKMKSDKVLGRLGIKDLKLSEYEEIIAAEVIHPEEISVTFQQIGGLDPIIADLRLLGAPKGVLLYGPPGCGKTMLAKALARESGATFINLHVSTLTDKWFGESNKLVAGLFSLARKLEPSIIFIDEIDAFLRERRSNDHEITGMMKAEFMLLWDGLASGESTRIIVLGATNRPNDIDQAILRRMPKRFAVRMPTDAQRTNILEIMLRDVKLEESFLMERLVEYTSGFSGSDLKELCRNAAMIPVREYVRSLEPARSTNQSSDETTNLIGDGLLGVDLSNVQIRALRLSDFFSPDSSGQAGQALNTPMNVSRGQIVIDSEGLELD